MPMWNEELQQEEEFGEPHCDCCRHKGNFENWIQIATAIGLLVVLCFVLKYVGR
jgi:hypothetical protein